MASYPDNLRYTKEHEWIEVLGDGRARVGITDHAQEELGDVVFVDLPEVGDSLGRGDTFGVVESVKAVSDLYAPVAGEILEVNEALESNPELVNEDPYGEGWMLVLKLDDAGELKALLDVGGYRELVEQD